MGQTNIQDAEDLNQIDWLLFSSQQLIEQVDASIPVQIVTNDFGEKILIISQISQDNILEWPKDNYIYYQ